MIQLNENYFFLKIILNYYYGAASSQYTDPAPADRQPIVRRW
jgi:hypothetical protein